MLQEEKHPLAKVPELTFMFWVVKILATTLGETGGDALSMSAGLGYLAGTAVFAALFAAAVAVQTASRKFRPAVYWLTVLATTTVGTTLADFADRSLGLGYPGGVAVLSALLAASFAAWRLAMGSLAVNSVFSPKAEAFYWTTIMFSQTLGTALGDWASDSMDLGYPGAAAVFGGALVLVAAAYRWTRVSRTAIFWAAFILTRPLGAVVGDFLDKPRDAGGLDLGRWAASAVLLAAIALCLRLFPQKAAKAQTPAPAGEALAPA